jgi:hypothetical protein
MIEGAYDFDAMINPMNYTHFEFDSNGNDQLQAVAHEDDNITEEELQELLGAELLQQDRRLPASDRMRDNMFGARNRELVDFTRAYQTNEDEHLIRIDMADDYAETFTNTDLANYTEDSPYYSSQYLSYKYSRIEIARWIKTLPFAMVKIKTARCRLYWIGTVHSEFKRRLEEVEFKRPGTRGMGPAREEREYAIPRHVFQHCSVLSTDELIHLFMAKTRKSGLLRKFKTLLPLLAGKWQGQHRFILFQVKDMLDKPLDDLPYATPADPRMYASFRGAYYCSELTYANKDLPLLKMNATPIECGGFVKTGTETKSVAVTCVEAYTGMNEVLHHYALRKKLKYKK